MANDSSKSENIESLIKGLNDIIADLEQDLAIPAGFFASLRQEPSDWAFIIKLHALFEAAVTHLLVHYFGKEQLEPIFTNLQMSDVRIGKVAFLNKLELLEKEEIAFIRTLSEIRNQYTHMIRNVNLPLSDIVTNLPKDRLQSIVRSYYSAGDPENMKVKSNPRPYIFTAALMILPNIYIIKKDAIAKRDQTERQCQVGKDFEDEFIETVETEE